MFRAIHQSRRDLSTPEALFDFIEENDVDRAGFEGAYRSSEVNAAIKRSDQMARRLKVASVPTIVIQGKYLVHTTRSVGQNRMLQVMDYLIALEQTSEGTY